MRMKASAGFVTASALGMACGPALACLFQTKFRLYKLTFNDDTLPGWFMALAWLFYLLWLCISFKEPPKPECNIIPQESNRGQKTQNVVENDLEKPLIVSSEQKQQDDDDEDDQEFDGNNEDSEENHKPATSILAAYRLLTPSIKVQLLIYFMLKYAMEILLAESSVITGYYFRWSTRSVALFLACLGLTVLPVNVLVGNYISNMFEERC